MVGSDFPPKEKSVFENPPQGKLKSGREFGAFSGLNVPSGIKNESSVSYKAPALRQSRTLSLGFRDFCLEPRVDITVNHKTKNPGSTVGWMVDHTSSK